MLSTPNYNVEIVCWTIEFERSYTRVIQQQILDACQCSAIEAHKRANKVVKSALDKIQVEKRKNSLYITSVLKNLVKHEVDSLNTNMSKNFGLSENDFNLILSQLKLNETAFFERVFVTHFADCMQYIQFNYGASHDDAYDSTMDAIIDFRERLVQQKIRYGNLRYLFTKMASQIYLKKTKVSKSRDIKESDLTVVDEVIDSEELDVLGKAWSELGDKCQALLKNHFYANLKLTEIADIEQKSSATIRKQKERCINRLKILFVKNENNSKDA